MRYKIFVSIVLGAAACALAAPASFSPDHDVRVVVDPAAHRIRGEATVFVREPSEGRLRLAIHPGLEVSEVRLDSEPVSGFEVGDGRVTIPIPRRAEGAARVTVVYSGEIFDPPSVARFSREQVADQTKGTIQSEGVFLAPSSDWYPRPPDAGLATFRVDVTVPAGWEAVVEGHRVLHERNDGATRNVYVADFPVDGVHLVAGPWTLVEKEHDGVTVAAYLFEGDGDLADSYLPAVERYLDLYSARLGPYPFSRFSVVENFFPTGYGMPGYTVLGREVMRLPFIVHTSLGHEVAHNWWGNGVFVDESGGNWCEGLTTYVADYHYKELRGSDEAADYRREAVRDYTNYVSDPSRDFPLTEFTERSTPATRAIGYGKTMMVFHMLERRLGRERFDSVLRSVFRDHRYREASWSTWRDAFSKAAGEDLSWFFDQWVERASAPVLSLDEVKAEAVRGEKGAAPSWRVRGALRQQGGAWRLRVSLRFEGATDDEVALRSVDTDAAEAAFRFDLPFEPRVVRGDPDQDLFRRLDPEEMPPVLSRVLGDPEAVVVVDDTRGAELAAAFDAMAATLTRTGEGEVVRASDWDPATSRGRTVFLLGLPAAAGFDRLLSGLPAEVALDARGGYRVDGAAFEEETASMLAVGRHPDDPTRAVALFDGRSPRAVEAAGRKLVHYGKYSFLAFVDGENRAKGIARVDGGPLVRRLEPGTGGPR